MNRTIFLFLFFIYGMCNHAQSLLGEYLKEAGYVGQNSTLISDAVAPALSIIRQQYRLERDGNFYGKNNLPFYGETYTLGIKVSGGTIIQRDVVFPWEHDTDFQRVKQGGNYKPAIFWSLQRSLSDSIWSQVELDLGTQYTYPIVKDSLLYHHIDAMSNFGLPTDEMPGDKKGYLVWAYAQTNARDSTMRVSLRQVGHHVETSADSAYYSVSPENADNVIGGVFVVPVIERAGYIKVQVAGVAVKNKEGKWVLQLLVKQDDTHAEINESPQKEKDKRKKDSNPQQKEEKIAEDFEPTPIKE